MPGNIPILVKFYFSTLHFRYGFGEAGKPKFGIEPNAELIYEVTLKSFEKVRKIPTFLKSWFITSLPTSYEL